MDQRLHELLKKGFQCHVAHAWLRASGRCEYCHRDLLVDRLGYAVQETDHLLPKSESKYAKYDGDCRNTVLSCRLCNGLKRDHVALENGECADDMLTNRRNLLLRRCREHIACRRQEYDKHWRKVREIVLGFDGYTLS